jgi:hypothetical protein
VLTGYAGIACGLFAGALAWAAIAVFPFFFADYVAKDQQDETKNNHLILLGFTYPRR